MAAILYDFSMRRSQSRHLAPIFLEITDKLEDVFQCFVMKINKFGS